MQSLVAAFRYLTIWGRLARNPSLGESLGAIALYFPLVGLFLGLLLALINYALGRSLDSELLSILLISFLVIATGAAHCEGAKKTFDALLANRLGPKNAHESIFGSIVLFLLILLKIRAVEVTDDKIAVSLLLAPALARWSLVIFIFGYHERCEETAKRIAESLRIWHLVVTTAAILGLAFYFLGRKGLWIGLSLSVLALLTRSLLHRRHAVLTQENFGAMVEISEALSFILLASL